MNRKFKFNLIDFSIILLSLAIIFSVIFWDDIRAKFILEEKEIEYSFQINNVTEDMLSTLSVNDKMFFEDNSSAGVIASFEFQKEIASIISEDGTRCSYETDFYCVKGKAKVKAIEKENGFYISAEYFTVPGKVFNVRTEKAEFTIQIKEIQPK